MMDAALAHRGPDGERFWIQGPIGLACQLFRVTPEASTEIQPHVHCSGVVLVFDGRLDNRDELLRILPPDQRQAIELAFFGGMSHVEIAQNLNEPLGTIKARIRRGMLKLRDSLQPYL